MSEPVTIEERVSTSIQAKNLRDEADKSSQTDILKALAWSKSRLGSALLRLHSEYDAIEKPRKLTHEAMVALALTMHSDATTAKERVKEKETLAQREASKWYANEKALFLGKLKTLPSVVNQVKIQCEKWCMEEPQHVATVIVGHWLNQVCPECNGLKFEVIPDSPVLSDKQCKACHGTGLKRAPYGDAGKRLLNHLDECVHSSEMSIRDRLKFFLK